eukprot:s1853_g7.t1
MDTQSDGPFVVPKRHPTDLAKELDGTMVSDASVQSRGRIAECSGDRMLLEGDYLHIEVDLRGLHLPFGTMAVAINSEPAEVIFDDITLTSGSPLMPVVCMGGNLSRVRLMPVC